MTPLRALLVDDEEPARELLRSFLDGWPDVEIVGEAGNGAEALELMRSTRPSLVFLDVQMPLMSGLDVVAALPPDELPLIVFVTAYDQYALRAFEVSAVDYLLKPFDAERFATTMRRVMARGAEQSADIHAALRTLLQQLRPAHVAPPQLVVKVDGSHLFLRPDEIDWLEASGKDVHLHLASSKLVVRESMSSIESRLDPRTFVRVHRSAIVNRTRIREMQPWFKGDYLLILRSGAKVVSGRTYRDAVQRLLQRG